MIPWRLHSALRLLLHFNTTQLAGILCCQTARLDPWQDLTWVCQFTTPVRSSPHDLVCNVMLDQQGAADCLIFAGAVLRGRGGAFGHDT